MIGSTTRSLVAAAAVVCFTGGLAHAQTTGRAVFVAHYFPINSVSPVGATVAAFRIDSAGIATLVENEPSGEWTQSLALSPNGKWLASANGTANTISEELRIYRVEADASLTPVLNTTTPDSPLDMTWVSNTVLAVTRTRSGGSFILTYRWDEVAGTLTLADSKPSGYFNSAVVRHPTESWIYTQDSGVFGGQASIQQWLVSPTGLMTANAMTFSIDPPLKPTISPDGRWMFSGTGAFGQNSVAVFSLGQATGAPSEVLGSPFISPGDTPYRTAISRDSRFLFLGHTRDDTVRTFTIDQISGEVIPTGFSFSAGPRSSLGPFAVLDDLLVVLKDSNDPIGMWVFGINESTGNFTQIGPLYDTGNRRPELAMAVWSPPITCPADINGDGIVGPQDIFDFLVHYFAGDPRADFNGVGGVTVQDIFDFLTAYFVGCN